MPNIQPSQPEKWFKPMKDLENSKLSKNETLALIFGISLKHENNEEQEMYDMFLVVRNGDKAIGRNIAVHSDNSGFCQGHATDFAEYPIEDIKDLVEEVKIHALAFAYQATQGHSRFKITDKPTILINIPEGITNTELAERMNSDHQTEAEIAKQIIIDVLGLEKTETKEETPKKLSNGSEMKLGIHPDLEGSVKLEKAAKEQELIKKFGKKKIEDLARQMGYKGEIINKDKTTTHVG